jgi:hypothetical protein
MDLINAYVTFSDDISGETIALSDEWTRKGHYVLNVSFSTHNLPDKPLILILEAMPYGGFEENSKVTSIALTLG